MMIYMVFSSNSTNRTQRTFCDIRIAQNLFFVFCHSPLFGRCARACVLLFVYTLKLCRLDKITSVELIQFKITEKAKAKAINKTFTMKTILEHAIALSGHVEKSN